MIYGIVPFPVIAGFGYKSGSLAGYRALDHACLFEGRSIVHLGNEHGHEHTARQESDQRKRRKGKDCARQTAEDACQSG
ncbi:hypothetical protein TomTYG75_06090 [Sphingobium sp. TomTYG75]